VSVAVASSLLVARKHIAGEQRAARMPFGNLMR
jgi:hypothetical protein